jgi:hypothetical protein
MRCASLWARSAVGMSGLTVWRAAAERSWALVLPAAGAAVFGVPFLYVAFTGQDPIGRLAAGDRTALAANKASIATSRPNVLLKLPGLQDRCEVK